MAYLLTLVLPITLVTGDILQMLVIIDMLFAHESNGLRNNLLGQTYLTCNLNGERATGLPNRQLEQRTKLPTVVEHGPIDNTIGILGKMLEIGIVRGDDPIGAVIVEFRQH